MANYRLRQVALVASDFDNAKNELCSKLGTFTTYVDPTIDYFGLQNSLFPVGGDCFIEIVSPIEKDVTAQRYLDKFGDGGYMLLVQVSPVTEAQQIYRKIEDMGLKEIHKGSRKNNSVFDGQPFDMLYGPGFTQGGIAGVHLHPKEVGCVTEISSSFPANEWAWAGDKWFKDDEHINRIKKMETIRGFAYATVACKDLEKVTSIWGKLLNRSVRRKADCYTITLEDDYLSPCELRFVASNEHSGKEGLIAIGLYTRASTGTPSQQKTVLGVNFELIACQAKDAKL